MDAEIKRKWIEALRSGTYKQGRSMLRASDRHCCLGVLCAVTTGRMGYRHVSKHLDSEVRDDLIHMNDAERKSFDEIADYIEQNL